MANRQRGRGYVRLAESHARHPRRHRCRKKAECARPHDVAGAPLPDLHRLFNKVVVGPGIVGPDAKAIGPRPAQHLSGPRGAQVDARADPRDARKKKSAHDIAHLTTVHREEDGGVHYDQVMDECKKKIPNDTGYWSDEMMQQCANAPHWSID